MSSGTVMSEGELLLNWENVDTTIVIKCQVQDRKSNCVEYSLTEKFLKGWFNFFSASGLALLHNMYIS